jgi:hypothetical protein
MIDPNIIRVIDLYRSKMRRRIVSTVNDECPMVSPGGIHCFSEGLHPRAYSIPGDMPPPLGNPNIDNDPYHAMSGLYSRERCYTILRDSLDAGLYEVYYYNQLWDHFGDCDGVEDHKGMAWHFSRALDNATNPEVVNACEIGNATLFPRAIWVTIAKKPDSATHQHVAYSHSSASTPSSPETVATSSNGAYSADNSSMDIDSELGYPPTPPSSINNCPISKLLSFSRELAQPIT